MVSLPKLGHDRPKGEDIFGALDAEESRGVPGRHPLHSSRGEGGVPGFWYLGERGTGG